MKGEIVKVYQINCGICGYNDDLWYDPPRHAREKGWSLTKKHGWICPDCVSIHKNKLQQQN